MRALHALLQPLLVGNDGLAARALALSPGGATFANPRHAPPQQRGAEAAWPRHASSAHGRDGGGYGGGHGGWYGDESGALGLASLSPHDVASSAAPWSPPSLLPGSSGGARARELDGERDGAWCGGGGGGGAEAGSKADAWERPTSPAASYLGGGLPSNRDASATPLPRAPAGVAPRPTAHAPLPLPPQPTLHPASHSSMRHAAAERVGTSAYERCAPPPMHTPAAAFSCPSCAFAAGVRGALSGDGAANRESGYGTGSGGEGAHTGAPSAGLASEWAGSEPGDSPRRHASMHEHGSFARTSACLAHAAAPASCAAGAAPHAEQACSRALPEAAGGHHVGAYAAAAPLQYQLSRARADGTSDVCSSAAAALHAERVRAHAAAQAGSAAEAAAQAEYWNAVAAQAEARTRAAIAGETSDRANSGVDGTSERSWLDEDDVPGTALAPVLRASGQPEGGSAGGDGGGEWARARTDAAARPSCGSGVGDEAQLLAHTAPSARARSPVGGGARSPRHSPRRLSDSISQRALAYGRLAPSDGRAPISDERPPWVPPPGRTAGDHVSYVWGSRGIVGNVL